jgi:maltose alpha-D-glucosyltransferase/alpha-amylase
LGPHTFYWFKLEQPQASQVRVAAAGFEPARLEVKGSWDSILHGRARTTLERILPAYLLTCRWFGGKAQQIRGVKNIDVIRFTADSATAYFTTWETQYLGATPDAYLLPLAFATGDRAYELRQANPHSVVARLTVKEKSRDTEGIIYDALCDPGFCKALLAAIGRARRYKGESAELCARPSKVFRKVRGAAEDALSHRCSSASRATPRSSTATD